MELTGYRWSEKGITLRPIEKEDWVYFYREYFDSEVRFFFYTEAELPLDRGSAQERFSAFLATAEQKGRIDLCAEDAEGQVIGSLDLYDLDRRAGTFQIAGFVCREARGKGYARRMLNLLLRYAFDELRLHQYNARIVEGNVASVRLHESIGCVRGGRRRDMFFHHGRYWDELDYGITAEEWRAKNT